MRKRCRDCKIEKDSAQFVKNKVCKDGIDTLCKECNRKRVKQWRKSNPDKRKLQRKREARCTKNKDLKRLYGITIEQYEEMLEAQGHVCAICKNPEVFDRLLSVDHCHTTGKIRGLLCCRCNSGIGWLQDSIENLKQAIKYLTGY